MTTPTTPTAATTETPASPTTTATPAPTESQREYTGSRRFLLDGAVERLRVNRDKRAEQQALARINDAQIPIWGGLHNRIFEKLIGLAAWVTVPVSAVTGTADTPPNPAPEVPERLSPELRRGIEAAYTHTTNANKDRAISVQRYARLDLLGGRAATSSANDQDARIDLQLPAEQRATITTMQEQIAELQRGQRGGAERETGSGEGLLGGLIPTPTQLFNSLGATRAA